MPVVIRELHVQVNVEEGRSESRPETNQGRAPDYDTVIRECVEKVMEIMERKEQR